MEIKIRQSDTLWYYSQLFDVPLVLIEQSNPRLEPQNLSVGNSIKIPGFILKPHTIETNDTLWQISSQYNVPMDTLLLTNQTIDSSNLENGSTISIPIRVREFLVQDVADYTYEKMIADIARLSEIYPFFSKQTIGNSVMGKNLTELRIGFGTKRVHVNGAFHANEWITTSVIMKFLNEYLLALTNGTAINGMNMLPLFMETFLSIVPMVNPDGVDLVLNGVPDDSLFAEQVLEIVGQDKDFSEWKANINGVDLNKQFPVLWEIESARSLEKPAPRDYPGPCPWSEPESKAIAELMKVRDFSRVHALHTQGQVIYWGLEGQEIANEYARVSGYESIQDMDNYTGFTDWFIQKYQRPGYTIELGSGVTPLPISQFDKIYEKSLGIFLANLYL
ncbi:peptidase M14 [Virgibacillus phasianinus]|uniref:Peptidase M14 n=1 Tax=Virgibacillus phasianinus TaxID=2017483 RepID=A0A220U5G4_9BACI|nr:M14 family metallopeptidase [Virgibacillus phasianinus]ASK63398.1 peptidase M14 [Virgibacillus phasianinus]